MKSDHATTALCEILAERHGAGRRKVMRLLSGLLLVGGLVVVSYSLVRGYGPATSLGDVLGDAGTITTFLMLGMTVLRLCYEGMLEQDASLLTSFRRGRCLPEILGTRIGAGEVVDGIARATLARNYRILLESGGFVGLAALVAALGGRPATLATAAACLAVMAGLLPLAAYGALYAALQADENRIRSIRLGLPVAMLLFSSMAAVLVESAGRGASPWLVATALLSVLALVVLVSTLANRWMTARAVESAVREGRARWWVAFLDRARRRPNPWIRTRSANPVVVRETAREARRVPFGLAGAFVVRGGLNFAFGMLLVALSLETCVKPAEFGVVTLVLLNVLAVLLFVTAAHQAVGLVAGEREAGALPMLLATPLAASEYAAGVAWVAARPLVLNAAFLTIPWVAVLAFRGGLGPWGALQALLPLLAAWTGAWVGLMAAAPADSRRDALSRANSWVLFLVSAPAVGVWVLGWLTGGEHFQALWLLGWAAAGGLMAQGSRSSAVQDLAHAPARAGLVP